MEFDFSREECINLESALRCEWLETNGIGGYASSTIPGCNTRKHHGLLVAPLPEHDKRFVFLAKMEAAIAVRKQVFHLSTNQYPGAFYPTGHKYLELFRGAQYPMSLYRVGDVLLRRSVLMVQGQNTVLLRYELLNSDLPITLQLNPMLAFRGCDELTHENEAFNATWSAVDNACRIKPYESLPALYIDCSMDSDLVSSGEWVYNIEYFNERLRGYDYQEDLFAAGTFELNLKSGDIFVLRASLEAPSMPVMDQWKRELSNRQAEINRFRPEPAPIRLLKFKASQFLISYDKRPVTITSSYPWGGDHLRGAMISSVGLTLSCGRVHEMTELIKGIGSPAHRELTSSSTIDTTFWFAWMLQKFLKATGDTRTVHDVLQPILIANLMKFVRNQVGGCTLDDASGLLTLKPNLTWMNCIAEGEPATPRAGMPVEVNALWFNALCTTKDLCEDMGVEFPIEFERIITLLKASYARTFWLTENGYLADVVDGTTVDTSIRPNQIIPVALPYCPLNPAQKKAVVTCVSANLLTPYGLRTLSPGAVDYMGRCDGVPDERSRAANRGTVRPWLVSFYCEAVLAIAENPAEETVKLAGFLQPLFQNHIGRACIGSVSEAFNGDPPHDFRCAAAYGLSVSETIRAWNILTNGSDV